MANQTGALLKRSGILKQKEKGFVSVRVRAVAGNISSDDMQVIAEVAKKYGRGYVGLTTRLNPEIPWIPLGSLVEAVSELESAGLVIGSTGPSVRAIVACKGTTCRHGLTDTQKLCRELDSEHYGRVLQKKIKIGISGCPNNCTKMQFNDIGFMGQAVPELDADLCNQCGACTAICREDAITLTDDTVSIDYDACVSCGDCIDRCKPGAITMHEKGLAVFLGGRAGRSVIVGKAVRGLISFEEAVPLTRRVIDYFEEHANEGERFGVMIERLGAEKVFADLGLELA